MQLTAHAATANGHSPPAYASHSAQILNRANISKATRDLQSRLQLASFKVSNGWAKVALNVLEPHLDQQLHQRRAAQANNDPPNYHPPQPSDNYAYHYAESHRSQVANGKRRAVDDDLAGQPLQKRPIPPASISAARSGSSNQSYPPQNEQQPFGQSVSGRNAASTLASFNSPFPSAAAVPQQSSLGLDGYPTQNDGMKQQQQIPPKTGGGDQETAAELMLYLAQSPSPAQSKRTVPSSLGSDVKGRRLFEESPVQQTPSNNQQMSNGYASLGPFPSIEQNGTPSNLGNPFDFNDYLQSPNVHSAPNFMTSDIKSW